MIRNLLAVIGLCVVLLGGGAGLYASHWGPFDDRPRQLAVSFSGLDLSTPAGQELLDRRIDAAIKRVCDQDDDRDLRAMSDERKCRRDARAGAEPQIVAAIDSATYRARLADERSVQLAALPPSPYAEPAPVAAPVYDAPPPPQPAYVAPAPMPVRATPMPVRATVVRRYVRPQVQWIKTKNGWVKRVVRRSVYRKTTRVVYQ